MSDTPYLFMGLSLLAMFALAVAIDRIQEYRTRRRAMEMRRAIQEACDATEEQ